MKIIGGSFGPNGKVRVKDGQLVGFAVGPIGWLVVVALSVTASFYTEKRYFADLTFCDGERLSIRTTKRNAGHLAALPQAQ